jgi:hypothetical protein
MGRTRLTEHLRFIYGPLEGRTVYFTDRKQDLRPAWSTVCKAAQKTPQEGFSYVFLLCFTVLLKQLRSLYTGGFIFQVPPVSDYSTYCTNAYLRVGVLSACLHVQCTNHPLIRLVHP